MIRWRINRLASVVLVSSVISAACAAGAGEVSISCRREHVCDVDHRSVHVIHLPDSLIVQVSDSVFVGDSLLVRDVDYMLDYADGTLYLVDARFAPAEVCVRYSAFPFALKRDYRLRKVTETRGLQRPVVTVEEKRAERDRFYDIRASGSKTVRLEAGTLNDLRVNQSLNLSIGGKIADQVEIRGVLSDKDMTIAQKTSTSKVKDLDRVFLEVRSPSAYARVGDLELDQCPGELLRFRRNMTGFLANGSHGSKTLIASGATTRSRYESAEVSGKEGIAGPYIITRPDGERSEMVRGSEKVYLDGQPLKRGAGADYTIDYDLAEIYFNPEHLIRDGARITVDYECLDHDSRRQFYFGSSGMDLGDRANLAVTFARETASQAALDQESPAFQTLSGESGFDSWVDGGHFVGSGRGSYVRISRDTLSYYEYVGEGSGDYDVTFTKVEDGEGSYVHVYSQDWDTYVYLYTGSGAYVDKVRNLPTPEARVLHLSASADVTEWFNLTSEVAQSKGRGQTETGGGDQEQDRAYSIMMSVSRDMLRVGNREPGKLDLNLKRRSIGKSYIGFDRLRAPDFLEKWAVRPPDGFEVSNELDLGWRLGDTIVSTIEFGSLETNAGRSRRHLLGLDLGSERFGLSAELGSGHLSSDSADRGLERNRIGVRIPLGMVRLAAGREFENRQRLTDSTSLRRERYYGEVRLAGAVGMLSLRLSHGEEDRDMGAGWFPYSSALEGRLDFEANRGRRFSLRGGAAQRRLDYTAGTSLSDKRISSGDLHMDLRDVFVLNSVSVDYRLENTLTSMYEVDLVRVDTGGDFDSIGNYVPGAGGYALSRRETGREPVTRVKADFAVEVGRKGKVLLDKSLSSRTALEVEGESPAADIERIAMLYPSYLLDDSRMVFSKVTLGEEVVFRRLSGMTMSVNARTSRLIDNRCLGRAERSSIDEVLARLQGSAFKSLTVGLEGRFTNSDSWIRMSSGSSRPRRTTWTVRLNLQRRLTASVRGRVGLELLEESRRDPASSFAEAGIGPAITALVGPLRCDAGCNVKRILRSEWAHTVLLPRRNSFDWNSRVNLRQGRYTSLSLEYTGRRTEGFSTVHNMRASLSATF